MECLPHILVTDAQRFQGISILFVLRESSQGRTGPWHPGFPFPTAFLTFPRFGTQKKKKQIIVKRDAPLGEDF